jgi:hypothetical protein
MNYDKASLGLLRMLMSSAPVVGVGTVGVIFVAVFWSGSFPVGGLQLTVSETLAMVPHSKHRFIGGEERHNWFRCANPKANEKLMEMYQSAEFIQTQITIVSILGHTGGEAEAKFVIMQLRQRSGELISGKKKEEKGDKYLLLDMLRALGNMGRRDVKAARQFVEDIAKGKDPILIPIWLPEATPIYAVQAYAFLEPRDLEATIQAALKRIPNPKHRQAAPSDYRDEYRYVRKLESRWIWYSELKALRRKAALLGKSSP